MKYTSNVSAAMRFGLKAVGTHAHSWVMAFPTEMEAFEAYAAHNEKLVFLVDTYDTIQGIRNAITVAQANPEKEFGGVRLDSGDLASLSVRARAMLDAAGFFKAKVFASGDLDEHSIAELAENGAVDVYGVGTKLTTCYDQPSLGGVYKLCSIDNEPTMKLSSTPAKASIPGKHVATRITDGQNIVGVLLTLEDEEPSLEVAKALRGTITASLSLTDDEMEDGGDVVVAVSPGIEAIRQQFFAKAQEHGND